MAFWPTFEKPENRVPEAARNGAVGGLGGAVYALARGFASSGPSTFGKALTDPPTLSAHTL